MGLSIIVNKPKARPMAIAIGGGGGGGRRLVIIRVRRLSRPAPDTLVLGRRAIVGLVPPLIQMALVAVPADALATVPDEEEAACA